MGTFIGTNFFGVSAFGYDSKNQNISFVFNYHVPLVSIQALVCSLLLWIIFVVDRCQENIATSDNPLSNGHLMMILLLINDAQKYIFYAI